MHPDLETRFDYDAVFGTVLNRFAVQAAVGYPLTFTARVDRRARCSTFATRLACVELACLNPPDAGEYRVFNQFTESFSARDLAEWVKRAAPVDVTIESIPNPRVEKEEHYYNAVTTKLPSLGLKPHLLDDAMIQSLVETALRHKDRVNFEAIRPTVNWRSTKSEVSVSGGAVGA